MVKVYVAVKRKLQVGDKMAGRHGNKGVISRILAEEDMPYLEDGTPVDICLNPLGVPSRMNIGQILEVHLGWAARAGRPTASRLLEEQYSTDGSEGPCSRPSASKGRDSLTRRTMKMAVAEKIKNGDPRSRLRCSMAHRESKIRRLYEVTGVDDDGQSGIFDGRSGERFDAEGHRGCDVHVEASPPRGRQAPRTLDRSVQLVTQQPLGGKAQFGGQRLGEMEVWAMEAYGAAYSLQEFLTVKSDDVNGRTRMYENIVKGENVLEAVCRSRSTSS